MGRDEERIAIVIQARMGSTRLPGKVLRAIAGEALLSRLCARLEGCSSVNSMIVATSTASHDQPLADACRDRGVAVFRGAEEDVLSRFVAVAREYELNTLVRVTGDNPLTDPHGIDALVEAYQATAVHLVHNAHRGGYPYGTGAELISVAALVACERRPLTRYEREHVTPHLRNHPEEFSCIKVDAPPELQGTEYFLTIDYPQDLTLLERIYDRFGGRNDIELHKIITFLNDNPALAAVNAGLHQGFAE
jgi:spore coat polysaccharide biosynthesis protein SpsF